MNGRRISEIEDGDDPTTEEVVHSAIFSFILFSITVSFLFCLLVGVLE